MDIKIYTTQGCFYCDQIKELCKRAEVEYEALELDSKRLTELYPNATSYPWVIIDGKEIGGLVETAKFFLKEGMVSVRK
jgi:glutaredoxin|tara:strand:+ start:167 stop:403 length:237 start_codon:yes stop_codon:yes gene_type:complete